MKTKGAVFMVNITEIIILSIDKTESESWCIEGEILFDGDISSPFSLVYYEDDDEIEDLELEIEPGGYDERQLKSMILRAMREYED